MASCETSNFQQLLSTQCGTLAYTVRLQRSADSVLRASRHNNTRKVEDSSLKDVSKMKPAKPRVLQSRGF